MDQSEVSRAGARLPRAAGVPVRGAGSRRAAPAGWEAGAEARSGHLVSGSPGPPGLGGGASFRIVVHCVVLGLLFAPC